MSEEERKYQTITLKTNTGKLVSYAGRVQLEDGDVITELVDVKVGILPTAPVAEETDDS
jgi:hypothetical protein